MGKRGKNVKDIMNIFSATASKVDKDDVKSLMRNYFQSKTAFLPDDWPENPTIIHPFKIDEPNSLIDAPTWMSKEAMMRTRKPEPEPEPVPVPKRTVAIDLNPERELKDVS
jgi:hypothetical protein